MSSLVEARKHDGLTNNNSNTQEEEAGEKEKQEEGKYNVLTYKVKRYDVLSERND